MEDKIREKALRLGYEDCGILRVGALAGFREKLEERIARKIRHRRYRPYPQV